MNGCCLAIDIGGSKIALGLVTREGKIIQKKRFARPSRDAGQLAEHIAQNAKALLFNFTEIAPELIGITIPGLADPRRGYWVEASFSGIRDLPIADILSDSLRLPAYADNDGQACALAEKLYGACRDTEDFIYVTVSNGIGSALFLNGCLYGGSLGNAGELGHCVVVEDGRLCACGNRGCLEMHAAGPGIAANYAELGGRPALDGTPADAAEIAARALASDPPALAAYALEGELLGKALAFACNIINPGRVVIGGGVSLSFPLFTETLHQALFKRLYRSANPHLTILPSGHGGDGGLLGAAAAAFCLSEKRYYTFFT